MAAFEKSNEKLGGRMKGTRNKGTDSIKILLNTLLPEEELAGLWKQKLCSKDAHIALKALEMAIHYMLASRFSRLSVKRMRRRSRSTSAPFRRSASQHDGRGALYRMFEAVYGPMRSERTEVWYPDVFTSPQQAADVSLCNLLVN